MMKLEVGQELFWVGAGRHSLNLTVTVTKVGRKWATLSNFRRVSIETFVADGGQYSPPGKAYSSKATYDAELKRETVIRCFANRVNHWTLRDVSIDNLTAAAKLLGISLAAP